MLKLGILLTNKNHNNKDPNLPHYASECFDELSADHYTAHLGVQRNSICLVPTAAKAPSSGVPIAAKATPKIVASLVLKLEILLTTILCQPNNTLSKARLL